MFGVVEIGENLTFAILFVVAAVLFMWRLPAILDYWHKQRQMWAEERKREDELESRREDKDKSDAGP